MKHLKSLGFFLLIFSSFFLIQCTTDPIPGPSGVDGIDGTDGLDGATGTTECATCHNVAKSEAVHASYLFSGHAEGGAVGYAGSRGLDRGGCARCHSNEGFIDYIETGSVTVEDYANPTAISCTTCHDMHTSFDFEGDGYDYALRTIDPVTLLADESYTIDYEGTSNLCANCHQPRSTFEGAIQEDGTVVVGSRFGPHYGAQTILLEGIHGAEIAGSLDYPAIASEPHRAGSSCTNCHMGETSGANDGNHTWVPTSTSCTECHGSSVPNKDFLEDDFETLEALLLAEGLLKLNDDGSVSPVSGNYELIPASALWNYRMIYYDHSHGVHNPAYAKALIKNSIEALSAN